MNIGDLEEYIQQEAAKSLPPLIEAAGLPPVKYQIVSPSSEGDTYTMGIYLYSPDGSVFQQEKDQMKAYMTLDLVIDMDVEDSMMGGKYLSVILEWLHTHPWKVPVMPMLAATPRADCGDGWNGAIVYLETTIGYLYDGMYRGGRQ